MRLRLLWLSVVLLCAGTVQAEQTATAPAENLAAGKAAAASLVKVELTLQFDKGEPPVLYGWGVSGEEVVREERPAESGGYLVEPTKVVVSEPMVHPRFVKGYAVRFGGQVVAAKPLAVARQQRALILELAQPLKEAKPLVFDAARKGPYLIVSYDRLHTGLWTTSVDAMPTGVAATENNRQYLSIGGDFLATDKAGVPVGLCMTQQLPLDDSWKGSPLKWPAVSQADLTKMLDDVQAKADQCLLRVKINFRSPRKARRFEYGPEEASATEISTVGVLTDPRTVLVLSNLKPNVTARLERITVFPAKGEGVPAKFAGTLTDYGALLASLEKPLQAAASFSPTDILQCEQVLLPAVQVRIRGDQREAYTQPCRIQGFNLGWKQQLHPSVAGDAETFVFDGQGRLLCLAVAHREKVSGEAGYGPSGYGLRGYGPRGYGGVLQTAVADLKQVLTDLAKNTDRSNVPLTEEEEHRLAWMGVELQPLNPELARANGVSDQTDNGRTGALVSHVYPASPAAKAGVQPGWILLRLHTPDLPKPIEVTVEEHGFADRPFPWDQLDRVPEQYYDEIPQPWPPAENNFTRTLTDLGFGKKFTAEFFQGGKSLRKDFDVVQSPPHYETAARYKAQAVGLTVRDLTYEVRRYFQKKDDEPGVIVSKIEPGSKASVAGVKPYEIITHVNDQPVQTVKDFEKLVDTQEELRLSVSRMTKGRIVKIKPGPATKPGTATRPTTPPPGIEPE